MDNIKKNIRPYISHQQGFTLIELIVALVLGLLIGAAALQVLLTSSRNQAAQDAASQIQDDGTFGLQMMKRQIMLANLGARSFQAVAGEDTFTTQYTVTDRTRQGGIVLTAPALDSDGKAANETNLAKVKYKGKQIPESFLSQDGSSDSNLQGVKSDQLTIQYQAPYDMTNCEGANVSDGQYVIERYFVRSDGSDNALACNAVIYDLPNSSNDVDIQEYKSGTETKTNDLGGQGTVILPRVDTFQVLLGITNSPDFATAPEDFQVRYVTLDQYKSIATTPKPRIINLKTAVLVRSLNPIGTGPKATELKFDILDEKDKSLKADSKDQLRNLYTNTILIRNGRGNS